MKLVGVKFKYVSGLFTYCGPCARRLKRSTIKTLCFKDQTFFCNSCDKIFSGSAERKEEKNARG